MAKKKSQLIENPLAHWRTGWDSNPRAREGKRISSSYTVFLDRVN